MLHLRCICTLLYLIWNCMDPNFVLDHAGLKSMWWMRQQMQVQRKRSDNTPYPTGRGRKRYYDTLTLRKEAKSEAKRMNIPSTPIKRMHVSHAHHSPSHLISQHGPPQRKRITGVSAGMCHISSHLITSHHGTSHHNTLHLIACHITNDLITLHYTTFIITCSYPI